MNSFLKSAAALVASYGVFAGNALANIPGSCGGFSGVPCQVPEPGTWALVAVAVAGVAIVSKFGKKK